MNVAGKLHMIKIEFSLDKVDNAISNHFWSNDMKDSTVFTCDPPKPKDRKHHKLKTLVCGLTLSLPFFLPSNNLNAKLLYHDGWENGVSSGSGMHLGNSHCCSYSLNSVGPINSEATGSRVTPYEGNKMLRSLVRRGDPAVQGHVARAELSGISQPTFLPYRKDRWVGFAAYYPAIPGLTVRNQGVIQIHGQDWSNPGGEEGPPWYFRMDGGPGHPWEKTYRWKGTESEGGSEYVFVNKPETGNMFNQWHRVVIHINIDDRANGNGLLEIWVDDVLIYRDLNRQEMHGGYGYGGDFYWKIGVDTATTPAYPMERFIDAFRIGDENSSYAEVDPAQGRGLPSGPPPSDPPPVDEPNPTPDPGPVLTEVVMEAEQGSTAGLMVEIANSEASGGKYARNKGIGEGTLTLTPNVESAGIYRLVARVYKWGEYNDVLHYTVNDRDEARWDINCPYKEWAEVTIPETFSLKSGPQSITFRGVNDSARLDYISLEKIDELPIKAPTGFKISK